MPTLTYLGDEYSCATAIKGADYIHLLNEAGVMIAAFDEIKDFSGFKLTNGSYTSPTMDHDCYLAVIRDDGTLGRGGHKCSDIPTTAAEVGAAKVYNSLAELGLTESTVTMDGILAKMAVPSKLVVYTSNGWASGVVPEYNGTLIVEKAHAARVSAVFISSYATANCYVGTATSSNTFGGWKKVFHEGNKPTAADVGAVSKTGDTMSGSLSFNPMGGSSRGLVYKNQTASGNYGTQLVDYNADGKYMALGVNADRNSPTVNLNGTGTYAVLHTGNIAANGVAKIESGTYVGAGTCGPDGPNEISFSFVPKMLWVWDNGYCPIGTHTHGYAIPCTNLTANYTSVKMLDSYANTLMVKLVGNKVSFYSTEGVWDDEDEDLFIYNGIGEQLNFSGHTYYYMAIG